MSTEINQAPEFRWSEITCGESCWSARHIDCKCSCGGKNHGIWLKGGDSVRTAKIGGYMYKLISAGLFNNLKEIQTVELEKYGIMRCYDYYGKGDYTHQTYADYFRCRGDKDNASFPLIRKNATLNQCKKWHELSEFAGINEFERLRICPSLLWEIISTPVPVKHKCGIVV